MISISILKALWLSKPLRWALAAVAGFVGLELYNMKQRNIGAERATATIEKATTNAAKQGKSAADKSLSGGVRGQRDPTTRE